MIAWFRTGLTAVLLVFVSTFADAADKTFQDDALDDAAFTLAADLKNDRAAGGNAEGTGRWPAPKAESRECCLYLWADRDRRT